MFNLNKAQTTKQGTGSHEDCSKNTREIDSFLTVTDCNHGLSRSADDVASKANIQGTEFPTDSEKRSKSLSTLPDVQPPSSTNLLAYTSHTTEGSDEAFVSEPASGLKKAGTLFSSQQTLGIESQSPFVKSRSTSALPDGNSVEYSGASEGTKLSTQDVASACSESEKKKGQANLKSGASGTDENHKRSEEMKEIESHEKSNAKRCPVVPIKIIEPPGARNDFSEETRCSVDGSRFQLSPVRTFQSVVDSVEDEELAKLLWIDIYKPLSMLELLQQRQQAIEKSEE